MRRRRFITGIAAGLIVATGGGLALAAKAPASWDGLTLTKSKRMDLVYLAPGADFRTYHKVMLDPTEVAFEKNWKRDFNNQTRGLGRRVDDDDIQKAVTARTRPISDLYQQQAAVASAQLALVQGQRAVGIGEMAGERRVRRHMRQRIFTYPIGQFVQARGAVDDGERPGL